MAFVEDRWKRKEDRSRRRDSEGREHSRSFVKKGDAQRFAIEQGVAVARAEWIDPRVGEAAALRRRRCELLRSRISVVESLADVNGQLYFGPTKTYASRSIAIPAFLRDQLARHLMDVAAPDDLVFTARNGTPLKNPLFHKGVWRKAVQAAALDPALRIHDLRHTCASLLIA